MSDKPHKNDEAFCCACWDWLRGVRADPPDPVTYDLCFCRGETLMRQCRWEFEKQQLAKSRGLLLAA